MKTQLKHSNLSPVLEPLSGFEPETPSLPWKCSTTELQRLTYIKSSLILLRHRTYYDLNLEY